MHEASHAPALAGALDFLERTGALIDKTVLWVCAVMLVVMSVDMLVAIFFRYVLLEAIVWSEELARYLMVWMASLAMISGVWRREHLCIGFLCRLLPARAALALDLALKALLALFLLVLVVYGIDLVKDNLDYTSQALEVNMSLPTSAVPVTGALMLVELVIVTILELAGRRRGSGN